MTLNKNNKFKERLISACCIPKDVGLGVPTITMRGKSEIIIESYRGIIEYHNDRIRVLTKVGQLLVVGNNMNIDYYENDEMRISGTIISVEYS